MKLFRDNIFHEDRIKKLSYELNHKEDVIEEAISIMYDYIRLKLTEVVVEDESTMMTEEEFDKTFPTIHIPSLGYIKPSYKKYVHMMKKVIKNARSKRKI